MNLEQIKENSVSMLVALEVEMAKAEQEARNALRQYQYANKTDEDAYLEYYTVLSQKVSKLSSTINTLKNFIFTLNQVK